MALDGIVPCGCYRVPKYHFQLSRRTAKFFKGTRLPGVYASGGEWIRDSSAYKVEEEEPDLVAFIDPRVYRARLGALLSV